MPSPSLRRDIVSSYLVTAMRLLAWGVITRAVFRTANMESFALLGIVQSTVGILEYAAIGLSPAIIRLSAVAMKESLANGDAPADSPHRAPAVQVVYANGFMMAVLTALGGFLFLTVFMLIFRTTRTNFETQGVAFELVLMVGIATLLRLVSDAPGAALQTTGRIFVDNLLLSSHELVWLGGTEFDIYVLHLPWQRATGYALMAGSALLLTLRILVSHHSGSGMFEKWWTRLNGPILRRLLIFGGMVVAAQMADYLYSPTNNLLIWKLINRYSVGVYAPAIQIDGGALLLVSALAAVLLPRTALAHAAGNPHTVRKYYIRGTLATGGALLAAAPVVWWLAPRFFQMWLTSPMPDTCKILPLVLIHTVIGGSAMVGRSVLLAIGKVRPFTVSVLMAGVGNVIFGYCFVRFGHLGLNGIVLGTIAAVTCRCAIWMPWYTLRALRSESPSEGPALLEPIGEHPLA